MSAREARLQPPAVLLRIAKLRIVPDAKQPGEVAVEVIGEEVEVEEVFGGDRGGVGEAG